MPEPYSVLAPVYVQLGMADFARVMTTRLVEYAQRSDWLGKRVLDLGCGTGVSLKTMIKRGYTMTGVDNSPEMLAVARADPELSGYRFVQQDLRQLDNTLEPVDLVLALDVFNELGSLNDLSAVFQGALRLLETDKWFIFDMHTIEGLTGRAASDHDLVFDDGSSLTVFARNRYNYERQECTTDLLLFRGAGGVWQRVETQRVLRAYPVQAIASLLQRAGFALVTVMTPAFEPFEPGSSSADRVIFVAKKP